MHQTPIKVIKFALVLWLCVFSWSPLRADPVNIEVVPSNPAPIVGDTFTADVVVSGLGNLTAPSLGAFDLNFAFNTSMVSFVGVTFGTLLGDPLAAVPEAITGFTPTAGNLNAFNVSLLTQSQLDALQPASFTLFTVTLEVVGAGGSSLEVVPTPQLGDALGAPLPQGAIQPGKITGIALIPTLSQSGFLLLILGLLSGGLYLLLRRRSS